MRVRGKKKIVINYRDTIASNVQPSSGEQVSDVHISELNQSVDRKQSSLQPASPRSTQNRTNSQMAHEGSQSKTNKASTPVQEEQRSKGLLFTADEGDELMQFDSQRENGAIGGTPDEEDGTGKRRFGKVEDNDSLVSGHSGSMLTRKTNLELVWQKANSINGIRKMNMQFKEERR